MPSEQHDPILQVRSVVLSIGPVREEVILLRSLDFDLRRGERMLIHWLCPLERDGPSETTTQGHSFSLKFNY